MLGQFVQFYPMLNVAAVPILTITLRNNLMQVLPIKRWLRSCDNSVSRFLLEVSFCLTFRTQKGRSKEPGPP